MNELLAKRLVNYIEEHPHTSFYELTKNVPGVKGEEAYIVNGHTVLWAELTWDAINTLRELTIADKITPHSASVLTYLIDGAHLDLPIAKQPKRKYKTNHWLPITFTISEVEH